jgi:hypothetical protein
LLRAPFGFSFQIWNVVDSRFITADEPYRPNAQDRSSADLPSRLVCGANRGAAIRAGFVPGAIRRSRGGTGLARLRQPDVNQMLRAKLRRGEIARFPVRRIGDSRQRRFVRVPSPLRSIIPDLGGRPAATSKEMSILPSLALTSTAAPRRDKPWLAEALSDG